jgi:hypothetical protein
MNVSFLPPDLPTTLADLLTLMADPVASKERLAQMQSTAAALRDATEQSKIERAAFAAAQADHNAALDQVTSEQTAKLAAAQSAFDAQCAARKQALDERDKALSTLEMKAKADADAAATARAEAERRLNQIRLATGLT